jgi:hypothetical protein
MDYLHSLGVLHGDVKGANVLLKTAAPTPYDGRGFVCKVRWGVLRVFKVHGGTPRFLPACLSMHPPCIVRNIFELVDLQTPYNFCSPKQGVSVSGAVRGGAGGLNRLRVLCWHADGGLWAVAGAGQRRLARVHVHLR